MAKWGVIAPAMLLAACSGGIVPPAPGPGPAYRPSRPSAPAPIPPRARQPVAATPIAPLPAAGAGTGQPSAVLAGLVAGPAIASLPIADDQAGRALDAFRLSCPTLVRRTDSSGLTRGGDWQAACSAAASVSGRDARDFFARWFESVQVGDGKAFATGYFLPEIRGSREHRSGYDVPIYGRPSDLVDVDLGLFSDALKGKKIRGRVEKSALVPYYDRTAIEEGALGRTAPVIAWGADPVEVFFLQIQGSGELRLPDGSTMRIGYDTQNGRDYTGIGKLMLDRGLLASGEASMQGIVGWLHAHPDQATQIMRENKSFVFFRELQGPAEGALGLPVTGGVSAAADPKFVPLGAPVFLSMDRTDATGLWIAQDTGGAIRGSNRFDTFWGSGNEAAAIAGGMSARGTAFLLLPRGTLARLATEGRSGGAPVTPDEAALWARVMASVRPIPGRAVPAATKSVESGPRKPTIRRAVPAAPAAKTVNTSARPGTTLDGGWDRRLARGLVAPDSSIDLHGATLDSAYRRLDAGIEQAIAQGDRVLLLVTGRPPRPESERPHARGAIRAAVGDWLAASRHAGAIAAVRGAHPRHGGAGALYIVLRRRRGG